METPCQVLGIAEDASHDEVRTAYRRLARRWHPDRFPEGPERLWAEEKMIRINLAYEKALAQCPARQAAAAPQSEDLLLTDVRALMGLNQLGAARQALMRAPGRNAEWNYLFGAILLRCGEYQKALLYFGVASRLNPDNAQYRAAVKSAESLVARERQPLLRRITSQLLGGRAPHPKQRMGDR